MSDVNNINKIKDVQELSREVKDMRKEIDSMKELLGGLIKVMMDHDDHNKSPGNRDTHIQYTQYKEL